MFLIWAKYVSPGLLEECFLAGTYYSLISYDYVALKVLSLTY